MLKRWGLSIGLAAVLCLAANPASADLFDTIFSNKGARKKADARKSSQPVGMKFVVYLTTGDVLKAVEYKGGDTKKRSAFRFISNFESDIEVKTSYIKYIDLDMVGEQVIEDEYTQSKADRVYLRNQDYLTGKIVGFTPKDVLVATTYGDLRADISQVRYVIFRNPSAMPSAEPSPAESAAPAADETK